MAATDARYDEVADWYVDFTRAWSAEARPFLPTDLSDQRVLDMACGLGELSRLLASNGASVTAVDLSANMLDRAIDQERAQPLASATWSAT